MSQTGVDYTFIEADLKRFLNERFRDVQILSVTIDDDTDLGDKRVLEISVVFSGTPADLVRDRPLGLLSSLKEHLFGMHEAAFPVLNFIAAHSTGESRAS